jgi:hypothetical protein
MSPCGLHRASLGAPRHGLASWIGYAESKQGWSSGYVNGSTRRRFAPSMNISRDRRHKGAIPLTGASPFRSVVASAAFAPCRRSAQ